MDARVPGTRTMNASEARQHFSELINQVFRREARILVEKSGIPVAAIISADDLGRLTRLETEQTRALERMRSAFADVPEEQIVQDVDRVVAEVRAERRQQHRPTPT